MKTLSDKHYNFRKYYYFLQRNQAEGISIIRQALQPINWEGKHWNRFTSGILYCLNPLRKMVTHHDYLYNFMFKLFSLVCFIYFFIISYRVLTVNIMLRPIESLSMGLLYHGCHKNLLLPTLWKNEVNYFADRKSQQRKQYHTWLIMLKIMT